MSTRQIVVPVNYNFSMLQTLQKCLIMKQTCKFYLMIWKNMIAHHLVTTRFISSKLLFGLLV